MVIALDIDDTITANPPFFSFLTSTLIAAGHRVVIVTFRQDRIATENDLRDWKIDFTELVTATVDELVLYGVDTWKAHVCRLRQVDALFEDSADVCKHVDASTLCLMPLNCHRDKLPLLADVLRE